MCIKSRVGLHGSTQLTAARPVRLAKGRNAAMRSTVCAQASATPAAAPAPVAGAVLGAAVAAMLLCPSSPAMAMDVEATTATFQMKCAGCHMNGGNVVAPGATLFTKDMERNGVAEPQALYDIIYKGKGKMPGFGKDCAPRGQCTFGPRFTDEEVKDMTEYVLARAAAGWK